MKTPADGITIAVDAMGGDHGLPVTLPAAISCLKEFPDLHLLLVGQPDAIAAALAKYPGYDAQRLQVHPASEVIAMDESPAQALRGKKDASMRVAIDLVKKGTAQACVSAGNTGALMAVSRFVLKTLPGIDRPAIIASLPTLNGHVHVLDLGANVDCTPEQLLQFGVMASILVSATENKKAPSVALLNIGEEEIKGNETVKHAAELLRASGVNYIGYVEGNEIYAGKADVVVCDGFVGNVALKASEGVAAMISHFMKQEFKRSTWTRLLGLLSLPVLRQFRKRIDHRRYNGATLLGLNGVVIKSHGGADEVAFRHALIQAYREAQNQVPRRISSELASMLAARQSA